VSSINFDIFNVNWNGLFKVNTNVIVLISYY
jgi:hypothetical protein